MPVVGSFIDLHGNPCRGRITFTSNQVVVIDGKTVVPKVITAVLVAGSLPDGFELPSTNDVDLSPVGWAYQVREHFDGGRSYGIAVPYGASSIDLATVAPVVQPEAQATVLQIQLAGLSTSTGGVITEADTLLTAAGKLQAQVTTNLATLTGHTGNTSNPHSVTAVQVGADPTGTAAAAIGVHEAAGDPHPQYTSAGEAAAAAPVQSVSGRTGDVTLTSSDVGLGNVNNTSDVDKPVSTAAQTALDLKAPIASPTFTGTVAGITKSMVGLGNVDNVSDAGKPVSTATQTALNLKAPLASPAFTGTPTGISKTHVGLANVDNTSDANKPVSTAQAAAISAVSASIAATLWVTGSTYTANVVRYSPTDYQAYRDTVGGLSSTDPASDVTGRWQSAMLPSAAAIALPAVMPTIALNALAGASNVSVQVTRAMEKYRYNRLGYLVADAAGVLGVDHDPLTKSPRGWKIDPQTVYLAMQSENIAANWTAYLATPTAGARIGPDGLLSATKIQATETSATFTRDVVATSAQQYFAVTVYKGNGATVAGSFRVRNLTTAADLSTLKVNYDTGVITHTVGSGATAEPVPGGWLLRIPVTTGVTAGNSMRLYMGFNGGAATAGDYSYVAQPHVSDKPNASYHPTAGSNITRPADVPTVTGPDFTDNYNQSEGTFFVASEMPAPHDFGRAIVMVDDGSSANRIFVGRNPTGSVYSGVVVGGVGATSVAAVTSGNFLFAALSYKTGENRLTVRGLTAATSSPPLPTAVLTRMALGGGGSGAEMGGWLKALYYYPIAVSAGESRALVTHA